MKKGFRWRWTAEGEETGSGLPLDAGRAVEMTALPLESVAVINRLTFGRPFSTKVSGGCVIEFGVEEAIS